MATKDREEGKLNLTRRDFLKATAATAAVGAAGGSFAARPSKAHASGVAVKKTYHTTCPYCSASCGQLVDIGEVDGKDVVLDVYGDHEAPWNSGGLCSKGAGTYQLVTNTRRIGYGDQNPNSIFNYDATRETTGVAYKREGNGAWEPMNLQAAMDEAALAMVVARGDLADAAAENNSKTVAFFGSSHLNNEQNNLYRKVIANFGTSNIEHQARI